MVGFVREIALGVTNCYHGRIIGEGEGGGRGGGSMCLPLATGEGGRVASGQIVRGGTEGEFVSVFV